MDEEFFYNVYAIVQEIPMGSVASYSLIAKLAGRPRNSRLVGKALRNADMFGDYPCHRVVHSDGTLVMGWEEQRELLEAEHVVFLANGKVDMKTCLWKIKV